ncbi:hypothetical protein ACIPRL_35635 [Streptomyces sp. NPDC090085]|uniref:hypothetical protein n=1 Tax=Streptomyces sp. NPDC090085 TaxID=3365943 RepID=UPI0037F854CE
MASDPYVVAGENLRSFVAEWLNELENPEPSRRLLLDHANNPSDPDRAFFGASYVMQGIAPRVWGDLGSAEELLLFAVLASYFQDFPEAPWDSCAGYVQRAFEHVAEIGEQEAARRLVDQIREKDVRKRDDADDIATQLRNRSLGHDPGRIAAHERELAKASHRSLRAARALDPQVVISPW